MSDKVRRVFSDMSANYDKTNRFFSLGTMPLWRREAAKEAMLDKPRYRALDIGTGTGELAFDICREAAQGGKNVAITGIDFSRNMVDLARKKASAKKLAARFEFGDALSLKYGKCSFDLVVSALVVKSVDSQDAFARESYRVLRKGGKMVILEMIRPKGLLNRLLINAYWRSVVRMGFVGNSDAYHTLKRSVDGFDWKGFTVKLKRSGFRNVAGKVLFSGAAILITATK
jgi:demethylmenaquinone methyltransferase/2-methoxy-6-polyprenyl-1,4-benzoquinol methylase